MTPLSGADVPQSDRLEAVADFMRKRALGLGPPEGVSPRHLSYRAHASRVLGWLDAQNRLTEAGEVLARTLPGPEERAFVLASFERTEVARRWMEHQGASEVLSLDPKSALGFLRACSTLSESTAKRRAGTLRSWVEHLLPLAEEPPPALARLRRYLDGKDFPTPVVRFLAEPVKPRVPTRMANWAERNGMARFDELLRREPAAMLEERNVGRGTLRQTDELIRRATGMSWARIRELMRYTEAAPVDAVADPNRASDVLGERGSWDALRETCSAELKALPLEQVALPSRMLRFVCEPNQLRTLGELLEWRQAALLEVPKLGARSVRESLRRVEELIESLSPNGETRPETAAPTLDTVSDFVALLKGRIARLEPLDRLVLSRRSGLHGSTTTLGELGEMIGVGRERARQIEKRAAERLAGEWWVPLIAERLRAAIGEGAITLAELGERDALFSEVSEQREAFDYALARIIRCGVRVVDVGDEPLLASAEPKEVRSALDGMRREARRLDFPVPWDEARAVAASAAGNVSPALVPHFERELESLLAVVDDPDGSRIAAEYGSGTEARVMSILAASDRPVTREELETALGGRFRIPDSVIRVARGVLALPKHVPDFDVWSRRLVPLCIEVMQSEDPLRQWSAVELLEAVGERAQLPAWLGHWHLGSMLRLSGEVRYLGRLQVALDREDAPEERQHVRDILVGLLDGAGGPLPLARLEEGVSRVRGAPAATIRLTLLRPPFFELEDEVFGLAPRDVPGGAEALAEAVAAVEEELEARQQGLGPAEVRDLVRELGDEHAEWTLSMVRSLARMHEPLRLNRSGGIGLLEWDDDRLPTRRELLNTLVTEAGGRLRVTAAQDQIESVFGTRPDRVQLSNLIFPLAIHLFGEHLVSEELMLAESAPPTRFPDPADLPDFPRPAVPLFRGLMEEPARDLVVLRREAQQYVEAFEAAQPARPHIDVEEARAAAAAIAKLIDTLSPDASEVEGMLVQAAARYFVMYEDAESDFAVGGLDDDIAVIDAVAAHLGRPDCAVQRSRREHRPDWYTALPDEGVRRVFEHILTHGVCTERDAAFMLGSQRALRRFARKFESLSERVPFDVRIDVVRGVKRYVREER